MPPGPRCGVRCLSYDAPSTRDVAELRSRILSYYPRSSVLARLRRACPPLAGSSASKMTLTESEQLREALDVPRAGGIIGGARGRPPGGR